MPSSRLETLERSLRLPDQRRLESVGFVATWLGSGGAIAAAALTSPPAPIVVAVILGAAAIVGALTLQDRLSRWWARRRVERLLASIPDGPSLQSYLELLGREESPRALEVEVELGRPDAAARRQIDRALRRRLPGAVVTWHDATVTVRSPAHPCREEADLEDEGTVTIYDNGALHAFFTGVLACTGGAARVRVREIHPGHASGPRARQRAEG